MYGARPNTPSKRAGLAATGKKGGSMTIAIIGAGNVGKTLGTALRAKGHTVIFGSRDPTNRTERNVKSIADALAGADVVILATPWQATEALVCEHAGGLAGKIVIDATNPIHPSLARLAVASNSSGVELLQSQARTAKFLRPSTAPALR